jgi:hypothetical protein
MGKTTAAGLPQPVRWSLLLVAGVVFGVLVGFASALTKPRTPDDDLALSQRPARSR